MKTRLSILLLAAFLLAACGPKVNGTPAPVSTPIVTPHSGTVKVTISSYAFDPPSLTIKVGTTVTWTNQDAVGHTVVADDGSFSSDNMDQGGSYSFTFKTAGTYAYHCGVHLNMKGTITVVP